MGVHNILGKNLRDKATSSLNRIILEEFKHYEITVFRIFYN